MRRLSLLVVLFTLSCKPNEDKVKNKVEDYLLKNNIKYGMIASSVSLIDFVKYERGEIVSYFSYGHDQKEYKYHILMNDDYSRVIDTLSIKELNKIVNNK